MTSFELIKKAETLTLEQVPSESNVQMSETSPALRDAQTILDSITDAFFNLNSNWEFSYVNRQTVLTLQCEVEDPLGNSLRDAYP